MKSLTQHLQIIACILAVLAALTVAYLYHTSNGPIPQTPSAVATATTTSAYDASDEDHIAKLAAIRPGCADTYKAMLAHTNTDTPDPSNFTVPRLLDAYTCGTFSDVENLPLADGKTIYFISPDMYTDCGSSGCWYSAFLEEKPGLVLQLRGFNGYTMGTSTEPTLAPNPQAQVFGALSVNKSGAIVRVKEIPWCGPYMENVYQIVADHPMLIASYEYKNDQCIGAPPTTIYRNTAVSTKLSAPSAQ